MNKQEFINSACLMLGFKPVNLINIDGNKWFLEEREGIGPELIKLERTLQHMLRRPIDLRLVPIGDKNKRDQRNVLNERK